MATPLRTSTDLPRSGGYSSWAWILQALSGVFLVVLVIVHMLAQHFTGRQGLLNYADVIAYLRRPAVFLVETVFLAAVLFHTLNGVRAILLDLKTTEAGELRLNRWLTGLGIVLFAYALVLTVFIVAR